MMHPCSACNAITLRLLSPLRHPTRHFPLVSTKFRQFNLHGLPLQWHCASIDIISAMSWPRIQGDTLTTWYISISTWKCTRKPLTPCLSQLCVVNASSEFTSVISPTSAIPAAAATKTPSDLFRLVSRHVPWRLPLNQTASATEPS
jgi:hypothetical protein